MAVVCSFPKHYDVQEASEIWDVIYTFRLAETIYDENGTEEPNGDIALLKPYIIVITYYKKYGLIQKEEKFHKKDGNGIINWNKTLGSEIPKILSNSFHFENVHTKQKRKINDITTEIMYVILEHIYDEIGILRDQYQLELFETSITYESLRDYISLLKKELSKTFIDERRNLIRSMIAIIEIWNTASTKSHGIFVNKYDLIFEALNSNLLGEDYCKQEFFIGAAGSKNKIELDHYSKKRKRIIDSKYYKKDDKEKNEYKQYFYLMHILSLPEHKNDNVTDWRNILIKPANKKDKKITWEYQLDREKIDNMSLLNLYVDIRAVIFYYTRNELYLELEKFRRENEKNIIF